MILLTQPRPQENLNPFQELYESLNLISRPYWNRQISCLYDYYLLTPCKNKGKLSNSNLKEAIDSRQTQNINPLSNRQIQGRSSVLDTLLNVWRQINIQLYHEKWNQKPIQQNTISCLKIFPICDNKIGWQEGDIILGRQRRSSTETRGVCVDILMKTSRASMLLTKQRLTLLLGCGRAQ